MNPISALFLAISIVSFILAFFIKTVIPYDVIEIRSDIKNTFTVLAILGIVSLIILFIRYLII